MCISMNFMKNKTLLVRYSFFREFKTRNTTYFIIIYFDLHSIFALLSIHKHFQLKNGGSTYCICTYLLTSYNKLIQCIMVKWGKRRLLDIVWGATWWKMGSKIGFLSRNYTPPFQVELQWWRRKYLTHSGINFFKKYIGRVHSPETKRWCRKDFLQKYWFWPKL